MGPPAARLSRRWFGPQARPAAAEEGKRRGCAVTQCRMLKMSVWLSQRRKNGGRTRARTWDPLIKSQLLYQLRSEEHTSELQSLMRTSYAVFCLKKKINQTK